MAKARVISAKQLNKIQPVFHTQRAQKDINNIVNLSVQEILLDNNNTQTVLNKLSKEWNNLNDE